MKKVKESELKDDAKLIAVIQDQYEEFRKGGQFVCSCGQKMSYDIAAEKSGRHILRVDCANCGESIENFVPASNKTQQFDSLEFTELFSRYDSKIYNCCYRFRFIEDPDDMYCDMMHRFFVSVMTYDFNGDCKFSTYMWNNIRRRFEDFERKNSRACKNNSVQCQLCGRYVGAITRVHLMNNGVKAKKGFPGHKMLHDKVIASFGEEKFSALIDDAGEKRFGYEWQGNKYTRKQSKIIKSLLVDAYKEMFPNYPISLTNVSISDSDPETNIEYINMVPDEREFELSTSGYYLSAEGKVISEKEVDTYGDLGSQSLIFIPDNMNTKSSDTCKGFATLFTDALHSKFLYDKKRKSFKATRDKEGLKKFLDDVLPYVARGYDYEDIHSILGYDTGEISFWLKKIKRSKEIRKSLNLR